jgi:signal transduction histidine kinase
MKRALRVRQHIRRRVFIPFGLTLLGVITAACLAILWQKQRCVCEKLDTRLAVVVAMFQAKLDEEAELMRGLADFLEKDPQLREAWLAGDRERLLERSRPLFEDICSKYRVTHFYFHDLEKVCFLRVHNPPRFGDPIDRTTLAQAADTGERTHGLELGPFGSFTLRAVSPWRIDGRLVGYIELDQGIEHIPPELEGVLDARLYFAVDKSRLDRAGWEEGLRMTGQTGQWDLAEDYVLIDSVRGDVPSRVIERLNSVPADQADWEFDFSEGSRTWRCGVIPLVEAGGREAGRILTLIDVSESVAAQNGLLAGMFGVGIVLVGVLATLSWAHLGRVQCEVDDAQRELEISLEREQSFNQNVGHELRTPLAGIRSIIDVGLLYDKEADELRKSLDDCSSIVENMEALVGRLLLMARLEGRRIPFHKEEILLSAAVDDCWHQLRERAAARRLSFENRIPRGLACTSDRPSLEMVFTNLLDNSVEYSDENGRIWVTAGKDPRGAVHAAVANTGCLLQKAEADLVFQQFWRADGSRGGDGRHAGLGLPLVRRLARALGGDASARVDENGVFTVSVVLDGSLAS